MSKSTITSANKSTIQYWNPLLAENGEKWESVDDSAGLIEQLTLAIDDISGDHTRLTRFKPGADTYTFGSKDRSYPEEIFVIKGRLYDVAFDCWLTSGEYASRNPGESHGPFKADGECIVLEISYPGQSA